jgi:RimJ/RimL family protein N-acetyltransferase
MDDRVVADVRLRGVVDGDIAAFFEHQRDEQATAMAGVPPKSREDFAAHWSRIRGEDTVIMRTITVDGHVGGNVVSWLEAGRREIGYWIEPRLWGQGIASLALVLFLAELGERPLRARVLAGNIGSIRVLEKAGFRLVERRRADHDGAEECLYELR